MLHKEVNIRLADLLKAVASVKGTDGVPLEITEAHWQVHAIGNR